MSLAECFSLEGRRGYSSINNTPEGSQTFTETFCALAIMPVELENPNALEPKPPEILQKIRWLRLYGWQYKWYVLAGVTVGLVIWAFGHFPPPPPPPPVPDPILGTWDWGGATENSNAFYTTFHEDHSAWSGNKSNGYWRVIDSKTRDYEVIWPIFASTNILILSKEGNVLTERLPEGTLERRRIQ